MNWQDLYDRILAGERLNEQERAELDRAIRTGMVPGDKAIEIEQLIGGQAVRPDEKIAGKTLPMSEATEAEQEMTAAALAQDELSDEEIAQAMANDPDSLTEEQVEYGSASAEVQRFLAELQGQNQVPPWVYAPDQGGIVRQLTDQDLDDMIALAIELDESLETTLLANPYAGEARDATMRRNLTGFVLPSGSEVAQAIVQEWGLQNEASADFYEVNGQPLSQVRQFAQVTGTGLGKASHLMNNAARGNIPLDLFAAVYNANQLQVAARPAGGSARVPEGARGDETAATNEDGSLPTRQGPGASAAGRKRARDRIDGTSEGLRAGRTVSGMSAFMLERRMAKGMELYGDQMTAAVFVTNPELAEKMFNDPWSMNREELNEAIAAVGDQDFAGGEAQLAWLRGRRDGQIDASDGQKVTVDTGQAEEHARQVAEEWNMPGIPQGVLSAVASRLIGEARKSLGRTLGNPFNPDLSVGGGSVIDQAGIDTIVRDALRGMPEYDELFGQMGGDETESSYAGRFTGQAEGLLGRNFEGTGEVARTGMRTGDIDTVGQNIIMTGKGEESSTFQERMARFSQVFREMT